MTTSRAGFSLVEVILSMMLLSVGILAMGASTGYILSLVRQSAFRTERSVAVRDVSDQLRATQWSNLEAACISNSYTVGRYTVTCQTEQPSQFLKRVNLYSVGPGYTSGGAVEQVTDTTAIVLADPS